MSELEVIRSTLERAARRRRWQRAWRGLWQGVFIASLIWLTAIVVYKLAPIPDSVLLGAAICGGLAIVALFVWGWLHKPSLQQTALWVDSHQQLHERLSTALEMAGEGKNESWRTLLISDAARFAAQVDPRKLMPTRLPQISRWALLMLTLAAGLGFVPEYRTKAFIEKKQDAQAVKEAGKKLVELTKQNLEHRPPVLEPTRKALESVEQMGMQLANNPVTRTEALKDIASASEKIKSELKQVSPPALKALERAARTSTGSQGTQSDAELQKKIDQFQKELGKATDSEALNKLKNDLRKAQQAAANLPDAKSPEGAAAREQLSQNLANMAQQAKNMDHEIPGLEEAIAALKENRTDDFVHDMEAATTDLDKLQQMNQAMQQLQQQAEAGPGKDLAEQLKNGQTDLAQGSLQKMMEQLKSPGLSQEKMKEMLDEVSRSVDPASPFGQTAAELKKAAQQMEKGNKDSAAKSLAKASEELQKLASEMQDAQSLKATLDALKKAETAIATRQGWGQCAYCGDKSGKCLAAGHCINGKKPGKNGGVGTWTADDSTLYPEMSDSWNNDGVQQQDRAAHGAVDRGDPQLADNLAPTKLKGQINPGGPMPSITLKGVSIKGQSGVEYQEAAAAAQSAAQSALNQDQVPRAYQGAVRDYFDDLKK